MICVLVQEVPWGQSRPPTVTFSGLLPLEEMKLTPWMVMLIPEVVALQLFKWYGLLLSLVQSVEVMLLMAGLVGSSVHVRLLGVVWGLETVQRCPGRPLLAQMSVAVGSGQVVISLEVEPPMGSVCEPDWGLMMVREVATAM